MDTDCLVPAALTFVTELDRAYPNRGHESDGSIAGSAHSAANPNSDHEHGTPQPGDRDVDAVDVDADLVPGDRAASERAMHTDVIAHFQLRRRAQYVIFMDRIAFADEGWQWRSYAYAGPNRNRHDKHAHFNWREDTASHNDTTPYGFRGVDDMDPADVWSFDPGVDTAGKVKRGGIGNPIAEQRATNPTIAPTTALAWMADFIQNKAPGLARKADIKPATVQMSPADRDAIVAALRAELPAVVRTALEGIEYAPRKSTP